MKKEKFNTICVFFMILIILVSLLYYPLFDCSRTLASARYGCANSNINTIETIIKSIEKNKIETYLEEFYKITLKYGDRMTGSKGSNQSAQFIKQTFSTMNDSLTVSEHFWFSFGDCFHPGFYSDENIIARLPGRLPNCSTIIFFIHYDTIEDSLGADDDGSGVAALLACAEVLSNYRFNHSIVFCASSGEEVGDLGDYHEAKVHYNDGTELLAAITADAIGYMPHVDSDNHNSVILYKPERSQWISDTVIDIFNEYKDSISLDKVRLSGFYGNSGNRAYDDYGFSTLKFFEGITNPGWEKFPHNNDTIEFINFSYLTNVTKLIAGTIASIANLPPVSKSVRILSPQEDAIYLNGKLVSCLPLFKGKTMCFGQNLGVKTVVSQTMLDSVEAVNFKIFTGENDIKSGEERIIVLNFTDNNYPFEYQISSHLFGWHTIRTTLIDGNEYENCDEAEVFFIS